MERFKSVNEFFFVTPRGCGYYEYNDNHVWRLIGIYGWLEGIKKYHMWDLISNLISNYPNYCVMFGDFDEIMNLIKNEGSATRSERCMDAFSGSD